MRLPMIPQAYGRGSLLATKPARHADKCARTAPRSKCPSAPPFAAPAGGSMQTHLLPKGQGNCATSRSRELTGRPQQLLECMQR